LGLSLGATGEWPSGSFDGLLVPFNGRQCRSCRGGGRSHRGRFRRTLGSGIIGPVMEAVQPGDGRTGAQAQQGWRTPMPAREPAPRRTILSERPQARRPGLY
jgi:hypothetical protein